MSIFSSILAKIFPSEHPANTNAAPSTESSGATGQASASSASVGAAGSPSSAGGAGQAVAPAVDVNAVLTELQSKNAEKLNWKTSIVDLLKLLGLDSSLTARKQLAGELGYKGSTDDSAAMNIWLQQQVMQKLAQNGGKLPADLKT